MGTTTPAQASSTGTSRRPARSAARLLLALLGLLAGLGTLAAQEGVSDIAPPFHTPTPTPPAFLTGPLLAGDGPDNGSIVLLGLAANEVRELTFGTGRQWFGDFAPDGCRFVFVMSAPSGRDMRLYTARLDGSDLRELLAFSDDTNAVAWEAWSPRWSPAGDQTGDQIAFVLIRDYPRPDGEIERRAHIALVSASGGEPRLISTSGGEGQPVWSPDGSRLAYVSFEAWPELRDADLWIIGADGENKTRLTDFEEGSAIFPRWSPAGNVMAFVLAPTGNNHQFWTIPAEGGAPSQWSTTWTLVLGYDWLPDGTALIAAVKDWRGYDDNLLWRIPIPGNADEDSTLYLDDPNVTATDYPAFSPDGRYLAFRSAYAAMLYDTTTGTVQELGALGLNNGPLVWSPPGFSGEGTCP